MLNLFLDFLNTKIIRLERCEQSRSLIFDHWNLIDKGSPERNVIPDINGYACHVTVSVIRN